MSVKLLTEHLDFLSLKGGCTGSPESTLHCWKSHVTAHSRNSVVWVPYNLELMSPINGENYHYLLFESNDYYFSEKPAIVWFLE